MLKTLSIPRYSLDSSSSENALGAGNQQETEA
jgi:hypothetical protein